MNQDGLYMSFIKNKFGINYTSRYTDGWVYGLMR